jgi:hypothetical protein
MPACSEAKQAMQTQNFFAKRMLVVLFRRQGVIGGPLYRRRAGIGHVGVFVQPSKHADSEIRADLNLAGETNIRRQVRDFGKAGDLGVGLGGRLTSEHFNPARRAAGVAPAPVENVHAGFFDA